MNKYLYTLILILSCSIIFAQRSDSTNIELSKSKLFSGKPGKAALYSLILPGAGQAYNKKYWKIPFATGAVVGMGFLLNTRATEFKRFDVAYKAEIKGEEHEFTGLNQNQLSGLRAEARKKHQTTAVYFGLVWLLNSMEAFVDAHLITFDTSKDLGIRFKPILYPDITYVGIGYQYKF